MRWMTSPKECTDVGLFKKIKEFVLGEDIEDTGWNLDGEDKEREEDMN